jgi:hypothetical protein
MASQSSVLAAPMPHKHNADRRHHIPNMSFKVQNWPEYEAGLRRRGSLTLWIEDGALDHWQSCGAGGQARYTDAAIQTSLMVRTAFSTGLQVYGAGQWLEAKHGAKSRRKRRKLHLAVDAASGMIVAQTLTDQDADDPSQMAPLLDQVDGQITRVTADGAYGGAPTYQTIATHGDRIEVVIPPRLTAVPSGELSPPTQRDRHLEMITERGRLAWQVATNYGQRSLIETTMGRYKALIGPRLRARGFAAQQTEAATGVAVLNRMLATGRPKSVRCQRVIA